jgi:hypothetical protein
VEGRVTITTTELLEALDAARATLPRPADRPAGVYTGTEIREATGWCAARFTREMRALAQAGKIEVSKVPLVALDGRVMQVAGYRILAASPKRKRAA